MGGGQRILFTVEILLILLSTQNNNCINVGTVGVVKDVGGYGGL